MGVPWCHDGKHAELFGGDQSVSLVTGQFGFESDPVFIALNGLFGLEIQESPTDTFAKSTPQPDGSLLVDGSTEFRATMDAMQIALATLPGIGEGKALKELQLAFLRMPTKAKVQFVNQLVARALDLLESKGLKTIVAQNELQGFAKTLAEAFTQILQTVGCQQGCPSALIGVSTWSPKLQFHLMPNGSATYTLAGKAGAIWQNIAVNPFVNSP